MPYCFATAAVESLLENGERGFRIEHIIEKTGISRSSLYLHFTDRDGLVEAASMEIFFREVVFKDFVGHFGDRAFMTRYFERHTEEVIRGVPKGRLLVYEVGEGWEPLCEFLGVPVPSTPFPHVNVRDDFKMMMQGLRQAIGAGAEGLAQAREIIRGVHKPA